MAGLVEIEEVLLVRDIDEVACDVVEPVVVRAEDVRTPPRLSVVPHHAGASVRADIVEAANLSVRAPDDQHGCSDSWDVAGKITARLREVFNSPDVEPCPAEDVLPLSLEVLLRDVGFDG